MHYNMNVYNSTTEYKVISNAGRTNTIPELNTFVCIGLLLKNNKGE